MSKKRFLLPLAVGTVVAVAIAQSTSGVFASFQQALAKAPTLESNYVVSTLGGTSENYAISLKKPNLAHIETPTNVYVADGTTLTTFVKADKIYTKEPQTSANLMGLFHGEALRLWAGFYNADALKGTIARDVKARQKAGESLPGFEFSSEGKKATIFVSSTDSVARQATFDSLSGGPAGTANSSGATMVLNTRSVNVGGEIPDSRFAFKAPANAKEVEPDSLNADKWYYDLDEAKKVAARTNKKIFVDFMADWCGPCKLLEAQVFVTDKFKKYGNKLVFLKIDVDRQKPVASAYQIEAMPTQMVLSKDGSVLSKTVGYGSPAGFYSWLDGAMGK